VHELYAVQEFSSKMKILSRISQEERRTQVLKNI
jgi:hypothetical protein